MKIPACVCLFAVLYSFIGLLYSLFATCVTFLAIGGYKDVNFIWIVARRDLKMGWFLIRYLAPLSRTAKSRTLVQIFSATADEFPAKKALISAETGRFLTFRDAENIVNGVSRVFHKAGFKKGDQVAMFMENDLEYVPIWLGLSRIGIVPSLINFNLQNKSLQHSLNIGNFKAIICHQHLQKTLDEIDIDNKDSIQIFTIGENENSGSDNSSAKNLIQLMTDEKSALLPEENPVGLEEPYMHIYTSGSTGQPKAAVLSRFKILSNMSALKTIPRVNSNDIVYDYLPMYHASGGLGIIAPMIMEGCTTVIRKKFSASSFITDCATHDVTFTGYIGEIWRYLLAQPVRETDKKHKLHTTMGNGLRGPLWVKVKERFGIANIIEVYGATEGNIYHFNFDQTPGAVGHLFYLFPFLNTTNIVKVDTETGELIRDENGRGIPCAPGEVGTAIGVIKKKNAYYNGYKNNEKATKSKIAKDVLREGDLVFLSGDLLMRDEHNYMYFVDRIGDTFRWKGENVSTTEVENIFTSVASTTAEDVIVYPVSVPGCEGNAGMAFVRESGNGDFIIKGIASSLLSQLPKYAIPMFIKVGLDIDQTGTFKYQKTTLKKQGYDLEFCSNSERIYVYDVKRGDYIILNEAVLADIKNCQMKF